MECIARTLYVAPFCGCAHPMKVLHFVLCSTARTLTQSTDNGMPFHAHTHSAHTGEFYLPLKALDANTIYIFSFCDHWHATKSILSSEFVKWWWKIWSRNADSMCAEMLTRSIGTKWFYIIFLPWVWDKPETSYRVSFFTGSVYKCRNITTFIYEW